MEFLTRLRTVWTAAWVVAAVVCLAGYMGNPQPNLLALAIASAVSAASFHVPGTWRFKLSVLWLGGAGIALVGSQLGRIDGSKLVLHSVVLIVGVWAAAAVVVFLVGGLTSKSSKVSGTD